MTFAELTDIWLNQYNPVASERWKYRMQSLLNCHLLPSIGQMKVRDLRQIHLQAIISDKAKNGYATSMMKKIKQTAERIMRVAIDSDLIAKNPFSGVKVPVIEAEGRRALTPEEISLITNNWKGTLFGHGAMIMLYALKRTIVKRIKKIFFSLLSLHCIFSLPFHLTSILPNISFFQHTTIYM